MQYFCSPKLYDIDFRLCLKLYNSCAELSQRLLNARNKNTNQINLEWFRGAKITNSGSDLLRLASKQALLIWTFSDSQSAQVL